MLGPKGIPAPVGATATLLEDGTVLVAGGYWPGQSHAATSSAVLYDPSTNRFSSTGSMAVPALAS